MYLSLSFCCASLYSNTLYPAGQKSDFLCLRRTDKRKTNGEVIKHDRKKQQNKPNENPEHNDLTDTIPNEELKENMNDEKHKRQQRDNSQSERDYDTK